MADALPFRCTACDAESDLRTALDGDLGGRFHEIYECPSCGKVDRRTTTTPSDPDDDEPQISN